MLNENDFFYKLRNSKWLSWDHTLREMWLKNQLNYISRPFGVWISSKKIWKFCFYSRLIYTVGAEGMPGWEKTYSTNIRRLISMRLKYKNDIFHRNPCIRIRFSQKHNDLQNFEPFKPLKLFQSKIRFHY